MVSGFECWQYGVKRGRLCAGGSRWSSWWRELVRIRDGGGELEEGWFGGHISKKVGNGIDSWVDGTPLCERFRRLYDLAENKSVLVAEMFLVAEIVDQTVVHGGWWFRSVQMYPEEGCVPAGTPTIKSVEEGVGAVMKINCSSFRCRALYFAGEVTPLTNGQICWVDPHMGLLDDPFLSDWALGPVQNRIPPSRHARARG
ncbi:hypothetical protein TSUD_288720 [Trifolium subterraneum]|uniref:Uncharacterized protein n=1 Tax=Trifolium subterraneum TaxID=3900 RepID=A0A2Z6MIN9_TRISU|nr:hypothetical protein TSUD_288720 [Trifolium subterraneum]